jgi:hypothetical protein
MPITKTLQVAEPTPFVVGKNKIINGDFGVWQRGTSFSNPASGSFTADRWSVVWDGTGATRTVSQQAFTPGSAPVAGYEGRYFYRFAQSVAGSGGTYNLFQNRMEDVRTFAGQTVTISFWAKAAANTNLVKLNWEQDYGTGGSPSGTTSFDLSTGTISLTTSWQRFSYTVSIPSIDGKTLGTTTTGYAGLRIWLPTNSTFTVDFWGVQVEAGSVVTPFQTATGTIQGELAACQRYYVRFNSSASFPYALFTLGAGTGSSTNCVGWTSLPVEMRIVPQSVEYGGTIRIIPFGGNESNVSSISLQDRTNNKIVSITYNGSGMTSGLYAYVRANNDANAYLGISAEF